MVEAQSLGVGIHDGSYTQIDDAAHGAHQVDDGVALGAQGLGGDVGHEGHGRGAVGAHGNEQQTQYDDEGNELVGRGFCGVAVVQDGEDIHQNHSHGSARQNEGGTAADFGVDFVGDAAKDGQQEEGQNVVHGHDGAGQCFIHTESGFQQQGNDAVVHLPEGGDGQEGETHQKGAFVIEFHVFVSSLICIGCSFSRGTGDTIQYIIAQPQAKCTCKLRNEKEKIRKR